MKRELRKKKRKLTNEDGLEILNRSQYGILSTISSDNTPYGIPLSYVHYKSAIYFHSAIEGHKLDNIINNNSVCFTVVGQTKLLPQKFSTNYESVVVFGKAFEISNEEKETALFELIKKYSPDFLESGKKYISTAKDKTKVIKIEIESLTAKGSK